MLLKFYHHTLSRMLNESAQIVVIITKYIPITEENANAHSLEKYAMRQFHLLMAEKAHTVAYTLDDDLGAPVFLLDAISDLRTILSAYDSSMAPLTRDDEELFAILDIALRPYLRQCEQISQVLPELSQCIMLSNCYDLTKVFASDSVLIDI